MGGAASVEGEGDMMMSTTPSGKEVARPAGGDELSINRKPVRGDREQIFELGNNTESLKAVDIKSLFEGVDKDPATHKQLYDALSGFFILDDASKQSTKVDLLIRAMVKEDFPEGHNLINEGEPGSQLFVVDDGELEVTINGAYIRTMTRGSLLGELALLYDAPRSATVKCKTACSLWTLRREVFKTIQAVASSAAQIQRARWLVNAKELALLSAIDLSRLISTLRLQRYEMHEYLYREKVVTNQVVLIESGHAQIYTSEDMSNMSGPEIDMTLGIIRPKSKRKSVAKMDEAQLQRFMDEQDAEDADGSAAPTNAVKSDETPSGFLACEVYEGCILGMPGLRGKAGMPKAWAWTTCPDGVMSTGSAGSECKITEGAEAGYSCFSGSKMECIDFTIEVFERLFGSAAKALKVDKGDKAEEKSVAKVAVERKFDYTKFEMKCVLGSGSFGVVVLAEYKDAGQTQAQRFALKLLSKCDVMETGQLRHVLDERKLLSQMDSPFILKMYGTYQTPHRLVVVTEVLECGDLWSVIYDVPEHYDARGLKKEVASFYSASLILALAHVHENGIVFRDLKPENVMLDSKGYIRIIDFGFAKVVPFTKEDKEKGELVVHAKTYTLCGTPEYLAPEFIFNLGHDASSDLWALGVVIHEMTMACTPFTPRRQGDMTELFTNIATVKRNGLRLSAEIQKKPHGSQAAALITQLLKPEPSE